MGEKCNKCGGELIVGEMAGMHGFFFYPMGEINKFKPKRSPIVCECCKECGNIQNIRVTKVEKIK